MPLIKCFSFPIYLHLRGILSTIEDTTVQRQLQNKHAADGYAQGRREQCCFIHDARMFELQVENTKSRCVSSRWVDRGRHGPAETE